MDIKPLIELVYPFQGETLDNLSRREHRKSFAAFEKKFADRHDITLAELINYASRDDSPSLKLSEDAHRKMVCLLTECCRSDTVASISSRMARSLSLMPVFWYTGRLEFTDDYRATYTAGKDYSAEIPRIRKHIREN